MSNPIFSFYYKTSEPIRLVCHGCDKYFDANVIVLPIDYKCFCSAKCMYESQTYKDSIKKDGIE